LAEAVETMTGRFVLYILTCGPFLLVVIAWTKLYWSRQQQRPAAPALLALSIVSANASLAASTFLYFQFRASPPWRPPWEDPQILTLGLLLLLAPVGMVVGAVAGARGGPKWLICIVEIASVPLLVVGLMASGAV
jgi:hypothetical protein